MDPFTPTRSDLHYAFRRIHKNQRKTNKDMVMHNKITIKKRTQHELE